MAGEANEILGKTILNLQVEGEDPLDAAIPAFANFVAVSHAGSEVQFEFIFLDLNQLAKKVAEIAGKDKSDKPMKLTGRTVSKVIVPVSNFIQLKDHLNTLFAKLEEATHVVDQQEATQEGRKSAS